MDLLFNTFHDLVKQRVHKHKRLTSFGEDSIRYDFYYAVMSLYGLVPSDLILEQPIPKSQFYQEEKDITQRGRGRQEKKPEFDFRVDSTKNLPYSILAEFAYFRRTEISAQQDKSGRQGKLLNEIFRLALLKHFENTANISYYQNFRNYKCLLICVTDEEMLNYGYGQRGRDATPILDTYFLSEQCIEEYSITTQQRIQPAFRIQARKFGIIPKAERIYEKIEPSYGSIPTWVTWIWEVDFDRIV